MVLAHEMRALSSSTIRGSASIASAAAVADDDVQSLAADSDQASALEPASSQAGEGTNNKQEAAEDQLTQGNSMAQLQWQLAHLEVTWQNKHISSSKSRPDNMPSRASHILCSDVLLFWLFLACRDR